MSGADHEAAIRTREERARRRLYPSDQAYRNDLGLAATIRAEHEHPMTLVEFLTVRLNEDEAAAKAWLPFGNPDAVARAHIARHDPARVLREVEAKRRIMRVHRRVDDDPEYDIDLHGPRAACYGCNANFEEEYAVEDVNDCPTLRLLALPYADHPDYREEWRP